MKQTKILSNYDGSIIWQCYLVIGLTLVLLVFVTGRSGSYIHFGTDSVNGFYFTASNILMSFYP